MLKLENTVTPSPQQWRSIIMGARNPLNSWDRCDSQFEGEFTMGEADHDLLMRLAKGGGSHAKYRRMVAVFVDITAPLYWWKEFDTYKVGTVANSCSTMHKIHAKEFVVEDFSCEKLNSVTSINAFLGVIDALNEARENYFGCTASKYGDADKAKKAKKYYWDEMIQLLPTSYNQKRTIMFNYEVLVGIYRDRRNHKLTEWHTLCDWIRTLPYSELITGGEANAET